MSAPESEAHGTEYLVLEAKELGQPETAALGAQYVWIERETLFARSARDAIVKHARANGEKGGKFAALPTRSFFQAKVKPETQTKLVLT
ncbi:MAG TPA: hypothetical protein VGF24_37270 [Vicinamibacterales bacterium]|jgi:hypothetical protein